MTRALALASLWLSALLLALFGALSWEAGRYEEVARARLDVGTWHQYCTQLLTQRGYWAVASMHACNNTPLSLKAAKAVLEDWPWI